MSGLTLFAFAAAFAVFFALGSALRRSARRRLAAAARRADLAGKLERGEVSVEEAERQFEAMKPRRAIRQNYDGRDWH